MKKYLKTDEWNIIEDSFKVADNIIAVLDSAEKKLPAVEDILNGNEYEENEKIVEIMNMIGRKRGAIIKGGNIDLTKVSKIILDDFKNGKLGKITIEKVEE